jgi:hypothetical protein
MGACAVIGLILIIIGIVLVLDELYLIFPGCGIGGFLGDLSTLDPTQSPIIHHWMLGVFLIVLGAIVFYKESAGMMRRKH